MKAKISDSIQTTIDLSSNFDNHTIVKEAIGAIVECYQNPEGYAVDLAIPNPELIGGFHYENVVLSPEQFKVISSQSQTSNERRKSIHS